MRTSFLFLLVGMITACGFKGPLYLPKPKPVSASAVASDGKNDTPPAHATASNASSADNPK